MKRASGDKGACDRMFSQIIRSRGACQRCGSVQSLQCAHIISRRYSATRCDERNAWCLCAGCHMHVDGHFDAKYELTEQTIGLDVFAEVREKALGQRGPFDWSAEKARLKALVSA